MMTKLIAIAAAAFVAASVYAESTGWKPAENPLMTRWAADVTPDKVWPEYPRPQLVRKEWQNLNGLWDFALTKRDATKPEQFDQKILVPFCPDSALSGLRIKVDDKSRMWYRRTFTVPAAWAGKRVKVNFGAVDWDATVIVNGKEAGRHKGGYTAFSCDITDMLTKSGPQELVLSVWDGTGPGARGKQAHVAGTPPGGIFYTRVCGIWQTVWLEPVDAAHIERLVLVPDVEKSSIKITALAKQAAGARVTATVLDGDKKIAEVSGEAGKELVCAIPNAKLWTPDQPNLYSLRVALGESDTVESYFGMRSIALGKDENGITKMMLNGKPVFHWGPLDQGFWPDGLYTPPTDEAMKFDIDMTKKYGFNMARKHVKVEPDRWYYWCDKLGLLVWQDMPSGSNANKEQQQQWETELKEMIEMLYSHPSIVVWVPFNEGWGQFDTERITADVKKLDPSRLTDNASGWTDMKVGDIFDIHSYPDPGAPRPEANRASVVGEYGGLGFNAPSNRWDKSGWGYQLFVTERELIKRYEQVSRLVMERRKSPGISGAVYTQTTDIEAENNGLMSYDRKVFKIPPAVAAAAHRGYFSPAFKNTIDGFLESCTVELDVPENGKAYYTTDGSEATAKSTPYTASFTITKDTVVKVIAVYPDGSASGSDSMSFKKVTPKPAVKAPATLEPGISVSYYQIESADKLPDFSKLTPVKTEVMNKIAMYNSPRPDNWAVLYEGFIKVPTAGAYVFTSESDDGSRVIIDGEQIVDNDGIHGMNGQKGLVALTVGLHAIRVEYFQGGGGKDFRLSIDGPGAKRQQLSADMLFHAPGVKK